MSTVLEKMAFAQFASIQQPSLQEAKEKMMERLHLEADQAQLNSLSAMLNQIVRSEQFETSHIAEKILERLPQIVDKGGEEAIQNLSITKDMKVYTPESSAAWQKYGQLSKQYKQILDQGLEDLSLANEVNDAKRAALSLQGRLSGLSGQAFESLLQVLIPVVKDSVNDIATATVNDLIGILDKTVKIETLGTKNEAISFFIGEDEVKISAQGKIDVAARSPFIGEKDLLNISAKNYSKLRDIHLLSGGSVVGLISQWPTDNDVKNYYYNALGVWSPHTYLQEARLLFAIQSLAGRGDSELANILILNIRSRTNPISVISIKSLLRGIETNPIANQTAFNMKFNSLPAYAHGELRTDDEEFKNRLSKITLDTTLNKAYLMTKYISQLQ